MRGWDAVSLESDVVVSRVVDGWVYLGSLENRGRRLKDLGGDAVGVCLAASEVHDQVTGHGLYLAVVKQEEGDEGNQIRVAVLDDHMHERPFSAPVPLAGRAPALVAARLRIVPPVGLLAVEVAVRDGAGGMELLCLTPGRQTQRSPVDWTAAAASDDTWFYLTGSGRLETSGGPVSGLAAPTGPWDEVLVSRPGSRPSVVLVSTRRGEEHGRAVICEPSDQWYEEERVDLPARKTVSAVVTREAATVLLADHRGDPVVWQPAAEPTAAPATAAEHRFDVFVSYKRGGESARAAYEVADHLGRAELRVFLDKAEGNLVGDWQKELKRALERTTVFAVILSDGTHLRPKDEQSRNQYSEIECWQDLVVDRLPGRDKRGVLVYDMRTPRGFGDEKDRDESDQEGKPRRGGPIGAQGSDARRDLDWLRSVATLHDSDQVSASQFADYVIQTVRDLQRRSGPRANG